jgi:hypothetical protein
MPPANAFRKPGGAETSYPLTVAFCEDCSLLQVPDVVAPEILFKDYVYATGASAPLVTHFYNYAHDAILPLVSEDDLMVDVGGNDCTLLDFVKERCRVWNIDPSSPLLPNVPTYSVMFNSQVAKDFVLAHGPAKVVTANNVLAHVDDLIDFLEGVRHLLADDGTFIFEIHWVKDLLDHTGFDQIYHEHLCYFSLTALVRMLDHVGLKIYNVEIVQNHGRSLRVFAKKSPAAIMAMVESVLWIEYDGGLTDISVYQKFATAVQNKREVLRDLLYDLKDGGARIVGYGAPAKGSTLINYCGLGSTLEYVVDGSKAKQGTLVPGTRVPVVRPERLLHDAPEYALLLSWNYRDHILEKEHVLRERGTKFIVPVPGIEIV